MSRREAKSFCRICPGFCGINVTIEDDRIVATRGDKDRPITAGYICSKANLAIDMTHGEGRIRRPLARHADGSFSEIPLKLELAKGQTVMLASASGAIAAFVESDARVRPGVVSISHGWGKLPGGTNSPDDGACTNLLVSSKTRVETINAMPTLSAIPVSVRPFAQGGLVQ
jgi:anaerobic selenocysteine-containing dehydrogenase